MTRSDFAEGQLQEARAERAEELRLAGREEAVGAFALRLVLEAFRASVSATSRAVSSAEKTSVTSRPKARWNTGRSSG